MADLAIQTHYITSGLGGGGLYMTGQYIRVIADGSLIRAELWTAATGGSIIGTPSGGPDLSGDGIVVSSGSFLDPWYCSGDDKVYYTVKSEWPYANYNVATDHPSCVILVCDLDITGYTTSNESTVGAEDGQVAITATSTHGAIEYSLTPDFAYGTGQASPITGLTTGNYVVYAKDAAGCTDAINIFIDIDFTYSPRWRSEYDCVFPTGHKSRVDIEERDYAGPIEEVNEGGTPFTLKYNGGDDRKSDSSQLVASEATIQLAVEYEGQFDDIKTATDRQYIVKKYKDTGSGFELEWTGYLSTEFVDEPYIFQPYIMNLKAIDGLGDLKNQAFIQDSGDEYFGTMSIIKIISECLKKLPVLLDIRSCVNIFEENMDTDAEDDPLAQTFVASENYSGMSCDDVISDLIKPFTGAELFQSNGTWWIRTKEQAVDTTIAYRQFDSDGVYASNSSISPRVTLGNPSLSTRLVWVDKSQNLQLSRPYGKYAVSHTLAKDNNMIDSGSFELENIDPTTGFFRDWNLFPLQAGISSGLEFVDNGDSKSAFFFRWPNGGVDDQALNSLASQAMPISIGPEFGNGNPVDNAGTSFKVKFQVYLAPIYKVDWIWMGWRLRFTDVDSGDFWDWAPVTDGAVAVTPPTNVERINDLYVSDYHSWKTYEFYNFRFPGPAGTTALNFTVQLTFFFHNHKGRDFSDFPSLRAVVTETGAFSPQTDLMEGKRFYLAIGDNTYAYRLENNTDAESEPTIIRPDDYNAISNPFQWLRTHNYNPDGDVPLLDKILIDNVSLSMFTIESNPDGIGFVLVDPPATASYEETVTDRNKSSLTINVLNGDAPPIVGASYIYNGFFKLSDGTPTKLWFRSTVPDERQKLLQIFLGYLSAQGTQSRRILSGSGIADISIGYINSIIDSLDSIKYRFVRFSFDDKEGKYSFEMEQTFVGEDGESPPLVGEFSNEFSDDFNV